MADITHVHLAIHGRYKAATLAGEEWQFGIDFVPILGATLEDVWSVTPNFDATYVPKTTSGTGYLGESNFLLEGGQNDIDPLDWLEDQVMPAAIAYLGTANMFTDQTYIDDITCWPYVGQHVKQLPVGAAYATITPTVTTWDGAVTSSTGALPPYASYAVSKETIANVPRGRGRFFPPHNAYYNTWYGQDGLLAAAGRTAHAGAAATFLAALKVADADFTMWPVVIGNPWTTAYKIVGVSVDNLPDTQRRRKAQLESVRTEATINYP